MKNTIKWGIIATGNIANKFARQFKNVKNGKLIAVGSRKLETAKSFADKYKIKKYYGSYAELVNDSEVDAVYIATPNNLHMENTLSALNAGKHVLCEKPFAINAEELEKMILLARKNNIFLMEAMWMRFNKSIVKLRELLKKNIIGDIITIKSDFGFFSPFEPEHRLFNPELGGGALLDIGIYPISLTFMILGKPDSIKSYAYLGKTGVDEQNVIIFKYNSGQMAQLSSGFRCDTDRETYIFGAKGFIKLDAAWHRSEKIIINIRDKKPEEINFDSNSHGLNYETEHMIDCINNGKLESDIISLDESLQIMKTMDKIRFEWNFKYPNE